MGRRSARGTRTSTLARCHGRAVLHGEISGHAGAVAGGYGTLPPCRSRGQAAGRQGLVARCPSFLRTAVGKGRAYLPPAQRGGVGVRLPRRDHDALLLRRDHHHRPGQLRRRAHLSARNPRASTATRRPRWAASRRTPSGSTTCTATSGSGAPTPGTIPIWGRPRDGKAWESRGAAQRVLRGGSWHEPPDNCRSAVRLKADPATRRICSGFAWRRRRSAGALCERTGRSRGRGRVDRPPNSKVVWRLNKGQIDK